MELTVNGKRLGRQTMPRNGHLKWKAIYQPGKVVATGYKNGKRIMTETIETTKPASQIVLKTDRQTITADGRDVAVVTVEIQDQKGRIVPDACPLLTFRLERLRERQRVGDGTSGMGDGTSGMGDARILGAGNGDPAYHGSELPELQSSATCLQIHAFNGLAQLLIQSSKSASTLVLSCSSDNLRTAHLNINTQ